MRVALAIDIGASFGKDREAMKSAATAAALTATPDGAFKDGELSYVASFRDYFALNRSSTATPDAKRYIATLSGSGVWERLNIPHPSWLRQTTWFVDSSSGSASDENTGIDASHPLLTDAERQRRWGWAHRAVIPANVAITVTYPSAASDQVNYDIHGLDGSALTIKGTPTNGHSGTFSAVTTLNRATPAPWDVTGASLDSTDIGKIITITSGARSGAYASAMKDLTGGRIRTTPFGTFAINSSTNIPLAQVTPVSSDPYQVISVPVLNVGTWRFSFETNVVYDNTPKNCVTIDALTLSGTTSASGIQVQGTLLGDINSTVYIERCTLLNMVVANLAGRIYGAGGFLQGVSFAGGSGPLGGVFTHMYAFGATSAALNPGITLLAGAVATFAGDCLFQNTRLNLQSGSRLYGGRVSLFDMSTSGFALILSPDSHYHSVFVVEADLLWGDSNTGFAVVVQSGAKLTYTNKPTVNTVAGTGRMAKIGGVSTDWASVPAVTAANNAMIVLTA